MRMKENDEVSGLDDSMVACENDGMVEVECWW